MASGYMVTSSPVRHYSKSFTQSNLCSFTQSSLTLCAPMDCSTPGLPIHHYLPKFAQVHVH